MNSLDNAKKAAGEKAVDFIQNGMTVGLGSGSTAHFFIQQLLKKCKAGLSIQTVASSNESMELAKSGGIEVLDIDKVRWIDITVDGADEIDEKKRMIKGAGGAHVREKILASSSQEMIVIVDHTKLVKKLGKKDLPVEVMAFGHLATEKKIEKLGYQGKWRRKKDNSLYITDNNNFLYDIHFDKLPDDLDTIHQNLLLLPGVIDTGYFPDLAGRVIIGFDDGTTKVNS